VESGAWGVGCLYNNNASAGPPTFACNVTFTLAVATGNWQLAARPPCTTHKARPIHPRPGLDLKLSHEWQPVFGIHIHLISRLWISCFQPRQQFLLFLQFFSLFFAPSSAMGNLHKIFNQLSLFQAAAVAGLQFRAHTNKKYKQILLFFC